MNFKEKQLYFIKLIEEKLEESIRIDSPYYPRLKEAMQYSLMAGGKRLRPSLALATAELFDHDLNDVITYACSIEMIHTYSLIHDDLPVMDNDDYRRGKLTNHKVYGDGIAILAGDGLLTAAFETMLSQTNVEPQVLITVVKEIAAAAGPAGMVGGQVVDLESEGKTIDAKTLEFMHQAKTGALFKAALRAGAMLAGANQEQLRALSCYADQFGLAFQITDDILDVTGTQEKIGKPVGSDIRNHKVTYVTLHTLEGANHLAHQAVNSALCNLNDFGPEAETLRQLVNHLINREA